MKKFIVLTIMLTFVLTLSIPSADAAWWNSTFDKREPINVTVSDGSTPTNYQVLMNITWDSNMEPDFGALRFISDDNTTRLDHFIQDKVDSSWALTWVEVDTINTTVWMYYDNSSIVDDLSECDATFIRCPDEQFDDGVGNWTNSSVRPLDQAITQSGTRFVGTNSSTFVEDSGTDGGYYYDFDDINDSTKAIRWYFRKSVSNKNFAFILKADDDDNPFTANTAVQIDFRDDAKIKYYNDTYYELMSYSANTWYVIELNDFDFSGDPDTYDIWIGIDNAQPSKRESDVNFRDNANLGNVTSFFPAWGSNNDQTHFIDFLVIREWNDPEPDYSIGPEESLTPPANATSELTINVFDEENPDTAIETFVAQFILGANIRTFGINKTFIDESANTVYGNFSYDSEFDTNSSTSVSQSGAGYEEAHEYINGSVLVGSSDSICVDYRYLKTGTTGAGGEVNSSIEIIVDEVVVGQDFYYQLSSAVEQDSGVVTSCFDMSPNSITEDVDVHFNFTSEPNGAKSLALNFFVTEVYIEEQVNETTLVIDQIDLIDGSNVILIEDANDLYLQREYVVNVDANGSNQSLVAYLIKKTEDLAQTTIVVTNVFGVPQSGALVDIEKVIGSGFVTVTEGLTDDVGSFSALLINNDFYRATVSKSGFTTQVVEFRAQTVTITIILNQTITLGFENILQDITIILSPQIITYNSSDVYHNVSFEYGISSNSSLLINYAMSVSCNNTEVNNTEGTTATGSTLSIVYNVVGCDNVTMYYNFTKNDSSFYENTVIFYPSIQQGFGLNEALQRMAAEYDTGTLNFLMVIVFIIVAGALTVISPEIAGLAWIPTGGIFVYYGMLSVSLYTLIAITLFSVLLIKRRWL